MVGSSASTWLAAVLAGWLAGEGAPLGSSQPPEPIKNGIDADTCQFPAAVAMLTSSGFPFCTGSLIHPEVVLFAAHCDAAFTASHVGFGEDGYAPARKVPVQSCHRVPGYVNTSESVDVAFCRLAEPVTDVPIVPVMPVMAGCEVEQLRVGDTVTIVGFGATDAAWGQSGWENVVGGGIKRYTTQTVERIELASNDLILLGHGSGGCPGDSGGPMLVELSDGSWRVAGVASTVHPEAFDKTGEPCGYGTVYDMAYTQLAWIESASGLDVTPCQTPTGVYDPEPGCGPFPRSPEALGLTWANGCATADVVHAPFCSPPDEDPPVVSLLSPSSDIVAPDLDLYDVAVQVAAHDDLSGVAAVWLRIDGQDQGPVLEAPPYDYPKVTFPLGRYTVEAVALDYAGNEGVSAPLMVSVGMSEDEEEDVEADTDDYDEPLEDRGDALPHAYGDADATVGCGCSAPTPANRGLPLLLVIALSRRRPCRPA
jgi:hypothetical protein